MDHRQELRFEENLEVRRCCEALLARAGKLNRGDTITHQDIEKITGHSKDGELWKSIVTKFRKALLAAENGGIVLVNIRGHGYRLATFQEQVTTVPGRRLWQSGRYALFGAREAACAPDEQLSPHQQKVKAAAMELARKARKQAKHCRKALELFLQPEEASPWEARVGQTA